MGSNRGTTMIVGVGSGTASGYFYILDEYINGALLYVRVKRAQPSLSTSLAGIFVDSEPNSVKRNI